MRHLILNALLLTTLAPAIWAQANLNLAALGFYADPEVHLFDGQYWIYPTSSSPAPDTRATALNPLQQKLRAGHVVFPSYLLQTSLDAFSSPDLVHWTRHSRILDIKDVPWAAYAIWAPTALHHNGKYYLFFAANDIQKADAFPGGIGVAVSDRPDGPFKDALGKPLIGEFHNGAQPIDPMIFEDTDGAIYFYYGGQGHCNVARLAPDLKSVIPLDGTPDGPLYKEITPVNYVEGPFMLKQNGTYYFMWSEGEWTNSTYGVAYARSVSPTGPFTRVGKILTTDPAVAGGPGHHSVLHLTNRTGAEAWYIVYHRHPLGTRGANERVLAMDALVFDANGDIEPVKMTREGPGQRLLP